jgi:4-methylaminobutanoate oxidase (formaldehyde-forming)
MDQVPIDGDVLASCADKVGKIAPALRTQEIAQQRGGLFTMSPDGHFLVGPAPGVEGFWLATGCNGSGFSMASGIARALAEWMIGGEPPFDLSSLDPSRLMPQTLSDEDLAAAGVWQYENYYTPRAERAHPAT